MAGGPGAGWGELGGSGSGAGGRTFRGAVIRVALAIPTRKVSKNPLAFLRLPHQWEGLQEGSGGQFKDVEGLAEPLSESGYSLRAGDPVPTTLPTPPPQHTCLPEGANSLVPSI